MFLLFARSSISSIQDSYHLLHTVFSVTLFPVLTLDYHYSIIIILYQSQHSQNPNFVLIGIYCFCFIKIFRFLSHHPKCHIRVGYLHFEQHKYNLLQILYIHRSNNTHYCHHRGNIKTRIRMGKYPRFHPCKNYPCTNIV